ncbi:MAG: hypothetical protein QM680_09150 [Luteolibacter sp.]
MRHSPDPVQYAYSKLIECVFVEICNGKVHEYSQLRDLANAMSHIAGILADYGAWIDDVKYRDLYLRAFDEQWGDLGLRLEERLDFFMATYLESK